MLNFYLVKIAALIFPVCDYKNKVENRPLKGLYKLDRNCMVLTNTVQRYHADGNKPNPCICLNIIQNEKTFIQKRVYYRR